jgi:hypothetical protein
MNPLVKRTIRLSAIILLPLSIFSAFMWGRKLAMSMLIGGILGLVNLRGLARGVEGLISSSRPTGKIIFFSFLRLTALAVILGLLFYYRAVDFLGILIGFTIVFATIITEGLRSVKDLPKE